MTGGMQMVQTATKVPEIFTVKKETGTPGYHCAGCDSTWTGAGRCHCSTCHITFGGIGGFDMHVKAGGHIHPLDIKGQPLELRGGLWRSKETYNYQ